MRARKGAWPILAALAAVALGAPAARAELRADAVLAELNGARADPSAYLGKLREFRGRFRDRVVRHSDRAADEVTEEGVAAVDEAIAAVAAQVGRAGIAPADLLRVSAAELVRMQGADGSVGHVGADGSDPGRRARRAGGGGHVWEVIAYGPETPADVVRQLIVDDGVATRWHRKLLFAENLRYAGVACGPHPGYRTVCVIALAETPTARPLDRPVLHASR